jgi:hypothetical protein
VTALFVLSCAASAFIGALATYWTWPTWIPRTLARLTLPEIRSVWDEIERHKLQLLIQGPRPRRGVRWGRQRGRHLA